MKERKPKKQKYVDDGHTIYSMAGLDGYPEKKDRPSLNRKERWAMIRAALAHYLPVLFLVIGAFTLTGLLLYFWLMY